MESFFLIQEILNSIELYCNDMPIIIKNQNLNSISLFWEVKEDQNTLWELFKSIEDRNSYFQYLKSVFEHEYLLYKLRIVYEPSLVEFNNKLSSTIHLEWNMLP